MLQFLAAVVAAVAISVNPASGPAPLNVKVTLTVTGPYEGSACLGFEVSEDGEFVPGPCQPVVVAKGETKDVVFDEVGSREGVYHLFGALPDVSTEDELVRSKSVVVTVE